MPEIIISFVLLSAGIYCAVSTGANEIAFNLDDRTYRRVLLPSTGLFAMTVERVVGYGNRFRRQIIDGAMSEIEGIQILERQGKRRLVYSLRLIWISDEYPPCVVNFVEDAQEAQEQALEIGAMLGLPVLEPRLLNSFSR